MMGHTLFCLLLLCIYLGRFRSLGDNVCQNEPRCMVTRTHGMKSIDCYNKGFKAFPKCIPNDGEVLDLSFNRIRKITRSDLSKFSYLKFLYLNENFFDNLQNDTFEDMDNLITLDLSETSIKRLPSSLFNLPSLSKLYLQQNSALNMVTSLEGMKPIRSPLSLIDISSTTTELPQPEFPEFGPMPYLVSLNISENRYETLAPRHFAGLCRLQTLISFNVSNNYEDLCDCWIINKWLSKRNVIFKNFPCSVLENECSQKSLSEEDEATYNNCLEIVNALEKEHRIMKIGIGVGVSILILAFFLVFVYFYCIRNKRNRNKEPKTSNKSPPLDVQQGGPLLLNKNSKTNL